MPRVPVHARGPGHDHPENAYFPPENEPEVLRVLHRSYFLFELQQHKARRAPMEGKVAKPKFSEVQEELFEGQCQTKSA